MSIYPLLLVVSAAMVFAAATDLFTMRIPNWISLVLLAVFVVAAPLSGLPWQTLTLHAVTGLTALALGFGAFMRGYMGGGDAKLLAAGALWVGASHLLEFAVAVGIYGGLLCVVILAFRRLVPSAFVRKPDWLVRLHAPDSGVPSWRRDRVCRVGCVATDGVVFRRRAALKSPCS
ncbi:MAG: peptidase [Sphingomonadales bacterium]|nr:peptidase [Sphingomonadales bacterium]